MNANLLDGLLLGDGNLRCNGRMKNAIYNHRSTMQSYSGFNTLPYLKLIRNKLEKLGIKFTGVGNNKLVCRGISINNTTLLETGKTYGGYRMQSRSSEMLTPVFNRWYKNQIKQIPEDLKLTPEGVMHWYIGDGSLDLNRGYFGVQSYLQCIKLATQSFTYDEHLKLLDLFRDAHFNIDDFKINKRNNGRKYALYIYRGSIPKFFEYAPACPTECYNYKFEYLQYWNNPQRLLKTISS